MFDHLTGPLGPILESQYLAYMRLLSPPGRIPSVCRDLRSFVFVFRSEQVIRLSFCENPTERHFGPMESDQASGTPRRGFRGPDWVDLMGPFVLEVIRRNLVLI